MRKNIKDFRKYAVGIVIGAVLMYSGQAFGETISNIGKKVTGELTVELNGNDIGTGVVISNKTYLPVRDIANAFKAGIEVKEGGVSLTTEVPTGPDISDKIASLDDQIRSVTGLRDNAIKKRDRMEAGLSEPYKPLVNAQQLLDSFTDTTVPAYQKQKEKVAELQKIVDDAKQELSDLEAKIIEYDKQITDLEAQKAQLQSK
ncbi:hypothetical protein [Cohnella cholangitidis]|uniref:Uncharacterized protein n=1 Tax=Cohnella cholangitidis TaxID=2598458 RepID=A0A7G5C5I9_9BACL|nr:hypothetical protein [Cohnella cholangitidis]QMV44473.1 hypothetical protein FPL14_27365 [Cohnella cholangitidis]